MRPIQFAPALVFLLASSACDVTEPDPDQVISVTGRVVTPSGAPVGGATVDVWVINLDCDIYPFGYVGCAEHWDQETSTDSKGQFSAVIKIRYSDREPCDYYLDARVENETGFGWTKGELCSFSGGPERPYIHLTMS